MSLLSQAPFGLTISQTEYYSIDVDIAATCVDGKPHDNWSQGVEKFDVPTHVAHFNALADLWAQRQPMGFFR